MSIIYPLALGLCMGCLCDQGMKLMGVVPEISNWFGALIATLTWAVAGPEPGEER